MSEEAIWKGEVGKTFSSDNMTYEEQVAILGKPIADAIKNGDTTDKIIGSVKQVDLKKGIITIGSEK